MPATSPLDNKRKPVEHTTDPVGPDLDMDTLFRLLKEHPLDKMVKDVDDRFPGTIEKALSEAARIAEETARRDGEKDIPVFKSHFTIDEIKENFSELTPFSR